MSVEMYEAAQVYNRLGLILHPLKGPYEKCNSPGKQPILKDWADRKTPLSGGELKKFFMDNDNNIGLVCGPASGITVIDFDDPNFYDILVRGLDTSHFLVSSHAEEGKNASRFHLLFLYDPDLKQRMSKKFSKNVPLLGIDILSGNDSGGGSNVVLPPSIHPSGERYQFNKILESIEDFPAMPEVFKKRLLHLIELEDEVFACVKRCRKWVSEYLANPSALHGGNGRRYMLAMTAELLLVGLSDDGVHFLARIVYRGDYDEKRTKEELVCIKPMAWAPETLMENFPEYCNEINTSGNSKSVISPTQTAETLGQDKWDVLAENAINNMRNDESVQVKNTKKEPDDPPVDPVIIAKAEEIMRSGDPIGFIIGVHQLIHVGDVELAKTLLAAIGSQSCLNSAGIQPKLNGDSGKGKSHCAKTMIHLMPRKYVLETSLSNKAIYYLAPNLPDGAVIYCDDVNLSDDMQDLIKRATTAFQEGTTHTSVSKDLTVNEMRTPKRVSWWLTSVDDSESLQLLNRQFGGGVDESSDQDNRVTEHQLVMAALGLPEFPLTEDVLICREFIRSVKEKTFGVWIPYAMAINWNDKGNRRNLPIFLDLIKSFAVLRFMQRETTKEGLLVATLQDFEDAKALYTGRAENQGLKLTNSEKRLCTFLAKNGSSTEEDISKALGVTASRVSQILNGKKKGIDSGLMHKVNIVKTEIMEIESKGDESSRSGTSTKTVRFRLVGGLDRLGMFDNVVSLDTSKLKDGEEDGFTPDLPSIYLKFTNIIDSGKGSFTQFTPNRERDLKEGSESTQYEKSQSQTHNQNLILSPSVEIQNGVKRVKSDQPMLNAMVNGVVNERVKTATDEGKLTPDNTEIDSQRRKKELLESAIIQMVQPGEADEVIAKMMEVTE